MREEILKLAKATGRMYYNATNEELEAFYIKAFNAGLEAAANVARSYEPACDTCPSGVENAIRALEMKP